MPIVNNTALYPEKFVKGIDLMLSVLITRKTERERRILMRCSGVQKRLLLEGNAIFSDLVCDVWGW